MIPTNPSGHLTSWPAIKSEYPRAQAGVAVVSTAYFAATGGHKSYKTDAPQSITVLRDQFDWAPDGSAYDLGNDVWHFKNQQLVVADKVVKVRGGVFVIEPGKDGRCGLLVRGRKTPLTFEGTTFIVIGEASANQEAAVYIYECDQPVTFRGCVFAGAPKVVTAYARQPLGAYEPLSVGRAISAKSSGAVVGAGVVIEECSFLCKDERQVATGQGTPAIDIAGTIKGNARQWFIDHKGFVGVLQYYKRAVVRHCEIRGGYYGISADACDGIVIEGNTIAGQMRCVSMQNGTKNAEVRQNALLEMASTAVHMAYGTHDSLVELNTASSTVIHGQAMIQAYCGCHDITVRGNTVATVGAAQGPWFYLYGGNGVARLQFTQNRMHGPVRAGVIGIDQSWAVNGAVTPGYTSRYTADAPLGVGTASTGHEIMGNTALLDWTTPTLVMTATTNALGVAAHDGARLNHNGKSIAVDAYPALFEPVS